MALMKQGYRNYMAKGNWNLITQPTKTNHPRNAKKSLAGMDFNICFSEKVMTFSTILCLQMNLVCTVNRMFLFIVRLFQSFVKLALDPVQKRIK